MKIGKKISFILKALLICAIAAGLSLSFNYLRPVASEQNGLAAQQVEIIQIDGAGFIEAFESGEAVIIDARSGSDFAMGHVPGAINVPSWAVHAELDGLIASIPKDKMIIVYCDGLSCGKSKIVGRKLVEKGFSKLAVYPDGLDGWLSLGKDLEAN
ncbi:rhodanese-like domain-containing protein [Maridesulfovibrio frigidus]|uniref:rhodanese-like domain-containing protein n=1 Tax=Maridesulfovibrio frigidus TaxID=340956 RepID=UPI0004E1F8B1|nr:rhodanese-like domain-containing protein [Maridesulfovibrio frigidus]